MRSAGLAVLALLALAAVPGAQSSAPGIDGFWRGEIDAPDQAEPLPFELEVEVREGGVVRGSMAVPEDHSPIVGTLDGERRSLRFEADFDDDSTLRVELVLGEGDRLEGEARLGKLVAPLYADRSDEEPRFFHDSGFELSGERPLTVDVSTLEAATAERLTDLIRSEVERGHAVDVSVAVTVGGRVADVRSLGWEDVARGVPATGATMYRWASLAKPLTAVATLQLVDADELDLDLDVRDYVPEFPEKPFPITARELLTHQAGIVHYSNGEVVATVREYAVPHPSSDRILCLDRFKDSPLVDEPGASFHYSSHGYVLLGAVVERAGKESYEAQVQNRIAKPLGMASLRPDYSWVDIPHRAVGYRGLRIGLATLDEDQEVGWKLPAGGWISTIADLARFGAGLMAGKLLEPETFADMCTSRIPRDGRDPHYGYGVGVYEIQGRRVVSHTGDQSKASTYMILCPEEELGVYVMSSCSNFQESSLARGVLEVLLEKTR